MVNTHPIDNLPIWGIYLLTITILFVCIQIGYRLGLYIQKRWHDHSKEAVSMMVAASLAFLGFLLALVSSIAMDIFHNRLLLVIKEANVIGTTYLRTDFLEEPYASESRNLLSEYVDSRVSNLDLAHIDIAINHAEKIQNELWQRATNYAKNNPSPITGLYISSLNDLIDVNIERINTELSIRVPPAFMQGLYLVAMMTMLMIGLHNSYSEKQNYLSHLLLVLILSIVFLVIFDLDRSHQGLLRVPQKALLDLQLSLQAIR